MQQQADQYEYNASEWVDTDESSNDNYKQSRKQSKRERQDSRRTERKLKRGKWE